MGTEALNGLRVLECPERVPRPFAAILRIWASKSFGPNATRRVSRSRRQMRIDATRDGSKLGRSIVSRLLMPWSRHPAPRFLERLGLGTETRTSAEAASRSTAAFRGGTRRARTRVRPHTSSTPNIARSCVLQTFARERERTVRPGNTIWDIGGRGPLSRSASFAFYH
jgi:hypothetical protein